MRARVAGMNKQPQADLHLPLLEDPSLSRRRSRYGYEGGLDAGPRGDPVRRPWGGFSQRRPERRPRARHGADRRADEWRGQLAAWRPP
jgi:hypothetical protein